MALSPPRSLPTGSFLTLLLDNIYKIHIGSRFPYLKDVSGSSLPTSQSPDTEDSSRALPLENGESQESLSRPSVFSIKTYFMWNNKDII